MVLMVKPVSLSDLYRFQGTTYVRTPVTYPYVLFIIDHLHSIPKDYIGRYQFCLYFGHISTHLLHNLCRSTVRHASLLWKYYIFSTFAPYYFYSTLTMLCISYTQRLLRHDTELTTRLQWKRLLISVIAPNIYSQFLYSGLHRNYMQDGDAL